MSKEQLEQLILQWRRLREYDWHDGKWIPDDESSLSTKQIDELVNSQYLFSD